MNQGLLFQTIDLLNQFKNSTYSRTMESSDILDKSWSQFDIYNTGYIYAKDVLNLISEINKCLPSKITSDLNNKALESWICADEMKKVSKKDFLDVFSRLIGTSFETAVFLSKQSNSTPEVKPHIFGNYRRLSQDTPSEDVEELKRIIEEWKDKYYFLERELQFFVSQERNPEVVDTTRHEFIISELSRKIQQQEDAIKSLRTQLNLGTSKVQSVPVNYKITRDIKRIGQLVFFMTFVLYVSYHFFCFLFQQDAEGASNLLTSMPHEYWWERNPIASRLGWYFKDRLENPLENNPEVSESYNSMFGIS